jgi:hypothetical protein
MSDARIVPPLVYDSGRQLCAMNPVITSRTIAGPGLKARPPMASYVKRAKAAQIGQREARERAEALTVMAHFGYEPFPPAPEMPAKLHQEQQPDPQSTPHYLQSLLLGILLGGAAAILFEAGRK